MKKAIILTLDGLAGGALTSAGIVGAVWAAKYIIDTLGGSEGACVIIVLLAALWAIGRIVFAFISPFLHGRS